MTGQASSPQPVQRLLGKAKNAANTWNNKPALASLEALEQRLKNKVAASKSDDWQLNAAVHYNSWAQFSREEMLATIDGMEGLVSAFCCEHCSGKLFVAYKDNTPSNLSCHCGQTTHTLVSKT